MSIPERFRQVRARFELSVKAMSELLEGSNSLWAQYETGRKTPSFDTLQRLSRMGISLDWLMSGSGSMFLSGQVLQEIHRQKAAPPSLSSVLRDIEILLNGHAGNRLLLWSEIMTCLNRRFEGYTLEEIRSELRLEMTPAQLEHELEALQAQGIVALSKGRYRLIKISIKGDPSTVELETLIAVKSLIEEHLPLRKRLPRNGRLAKQSIIVESGKGVARARSLGQSWESWLSAQPRCDETPATDSIHVILSVIVLEGQEHSHG